MQAASKREVCYNARDQYYECLDRSLLDPEPCKKLEATFTEHCPPSWVDYFNRKREKETVLQMQTEMSRQRRAAANNKSEN